MGSSSAQEHLSKFLYFVVIGHNDIFSYGNSSDKRNKYTPQQYVDLMATAMIDQLEGWPLLGVVLHNSTGGCNEVVNEWSDQYNQVLVASLQSLKSEFKDVNCSYYDLYAASGKFIQEPASYEVKAACCGLGTLNARTPCLPISPYCPNGKDHFFWDLYHPTEATARLLIDDLCDGPPQNTFPLNVREFAAN